MPVFKYEGTSPSGQVVSGVVEAFDEFEALEKARQQCRTVDSITQVRQMPSFLKAELGKGAFKPKEIAIMCSQFSVVIGAGMSSAKCVRLVAEQTANKNLAAVLREVAADVEGGHSLAESFTSKGGEKLPLVFYETIRAGEESGNLDRSFDTMYRHYDKQTKMRGKVRGALSYPIFVLIIAVAVVVVLMVKVVPTFTSIFESYGSELPAITRLLIGISNFFRKYTIWMAAAFALLFIVYKLYGNTEKGRLNLARIQLRLPVLGNIAQLNAASQFANTMTTMLASGLSMTKAISITAGVLDNYYVGNEIGRLTGRLEEGHALGASMRDSGCMPDILVDMVAVGEETGEMEKTLDTIALYYDAELEMAIAAALAKLEPTILIFLALVAGFIVIAIYMSIFQMYAIM